jgi:hypothetical protein
MVVVLVILAVALIVAVCWTYFRLKGKVNEMADWLVLASEWMNRSKGGPGDGTPPPPPPKKLG